MRKESRCLHTERLVLLALVVVAEPLLALVLLPFATTLASSVVISFVLQDAHAGNAVVCLKAAALRYSTRSF
jgi:hypothetical protein